VGRAGGKIGKSTNDVVGHEIGTIYSWDWTYGPLPSSRAERPKGNKVQLVVGFSINLPP